MTLGDDPFRKRDPDSGTGSEQHGAAPSGSGGQAPGADPYGQSQYGQGQYGQGQYGQPQYGQGQYGQQQPYGQGQYGQGQYGQGGYPPPPYGSPYPPAYGQQAGSPPPGNLGWAIAAVIFFWPLAIAAFINYTRVESLWYRGDWAGAQRASDAVKRYGIIALCIGVALFVLWLGLAATFLSVGSSVGTAP